MRIWLKQIRESKGLTQEMVSKNSDISRSYYTHIESGVKTPTVAVAKKIASFLGFDWTFFFDNNSSLGKQNKQVS